MGFWSNLAKYGGMAAAIGGAAFTGGATLSALPAIMGAGGAALSGMAGAAAKNRGEQGDMNLANAQLQTSQAGAAAQNEIQRANLDLERRGDDRTSQTDAYKKALMSALAMNMQDAKFSRNGYNSPVANVTFAGGARPSAIGPQGQEAAGLLNRQALLSLMEGPAKHEAPKPYQAPGAAEIPKASFWEKLAGPVGMGLTAISNFSGGDNGAAPTPSARLRLPENNNFA